MKTVLVSDFTLEDEIAGGSEFVDDTVAKALGLKIVRSRDFKPERGQKLLLSNISTMQQDTIDFIKDNCDYVILEHDYKIHTTRHPWRFEGNFIPKDQRINYDLYKNAKAVFTQTDDHLEIFKLNEVEGNFISLGCSIWSEDELKLINKHRRSKAKKQYAVMQSDNPIKNTTLAEKLCKANKWDYDLIPKMSHHDFIYRLSDYSTLVFLPMARETCCRLLVEARALGLNTITSDNSGAFRSNWYKLSGGELVNFLREQSSNNLEMISKCLNDSPPTS